MEETVKQLSELKENFDLAYSKMNIDEISAQQKVLSEEVNNPEFWNVTDSSEAQEKSKKLADMSEEVELWQNMKSSIDETIQMLEIADDGMKQELEDKTKQLNNQFEELKSQLKFAGSYDRNNAVVSIHSGAGGLDAQDWANMLQRMFMRWAEASDGIKAEILHQAHGEEGGLKSASIVFRGKNAYGKMKSENGVHRLVRLSPFNSANSRETSFAMVEVIPEIDSPKGIEIDENDLKVDVFRAGGRGGQSVNTTDSAVRITHTPTGLVVSIQNERSQTQNKETALRILKSKLVQLSEEQHQEDIAELKGPNTEAAWGNQIRSYVLHPYTMVKDNRSGYQTTDVSAVLDGSLDELINAYLESTLGDKSA